MAHRATHHKGRGALTNPASRFAATAGEDFDDGWDTIDQADEDDTAPATQLHRDPTRRVISRNESPDVPFSASINPYKGCAHGCIYCFARPTHEYLDHSAGLDFETEIYYKPEAAALFEAELRHPRYRCEAITLGANTDPYQPDDRHLGITRAILEVAHRFNQPISIVTKGAHVTRDLDLIGDMAARNLASVFVSLTSLDNELKRHLEPRAAAPAQRLRTIAALAEADVPTGALIAPVIPMITDAEMESLMTAAAEAGATRAGYVLLRLPHAIKHLFREWLDQHYPDRAQHVMSLIQQMRGGADYDATWGTRMTGTGTYADLIARRFALACKRTGINGKRFTLDTGAFRVPPAAGDQIGFDFG
ncbi:PA0069 family radical SAM protein [Salinisphaera sp. LB1]|uniref:PA0069 family radical SAM protein n=1 Tax=Salinisphaera sp. LB1 TaxID=2183911 RepID=UPI000D7072E7|nr:PA0069 family radical SAM protein [Salinisphaera sp. LB1]AWN15361.1 Radical SAM domain protein [Salinisphaera sp. LB1]